MYFLGLLLQLAPQSQALCRGQEAPLGAVVSTSVALSEAAGPHGAPSSRSRPLLALNNSQLASTNKSLNPRTIHLDKWPTKVGLAG